ncbi:MAG: Na+/H+ antiporter subunit D [Bacillota bacterium]
MSNLIIMPVLLPFITGIILLFFHRCLLVQRVLSAVSAIALLILSIYILAVVRAEGILTLAIGDFPAPFGIILVADLFAAIMMVVASLISLVALFFAFGMMDQGREKHFFYALWQIQIMGIAGAFLTGDLFNLFVFFEILLIASYILLVLGGEAGQLREAFKYTIINLMSGMMFLVAVAVIYSVTGTLNMADMAVKVAEAPQKGLLTTAALVLLAVFGLKGALFPMYFWLPRSYFEAPSPVATLFGGVLTKVGVYASIRVFTLIFNYDVSYTHTIILVLSGFTMFLGVLGALSQMDFKRLLAYHIISQVGYMVMGLGLFTPLALAGSIFHIAHNMIVKSCLFLVSGLTETITGTTSLKKMGGLMKTHPLVAWMFFIAGISMAGVPPLSGFFSKFALIKAGLLEGQYFIVLVALVVSFMTMFSMIKIFRYAYWGSVSKENPPVPGNGYLKLVPPVLTLVVLTVVIGLSAHWFFQLTLEASEQLMNPAAYIKAVL